MTTRRESIIAALYTTLGNVAGVRVRRGRGAAEPISRAQSPYLLIEPVTDVADVPDTFTRINWRLTVRVSLFVRAAIPDQAADTYIQSLYSQIMADPTIGGRANDIRPLSCTFEMFEADQTAGIVNFDFEVWYQTAINNLATL